MTRPPKPRKATAASFARFDGLPPGSSAAAAGLAAPFPKWSMATPKRKPATRTAMTALM